MKKECEIVQDLLFSYYDGILSNSSKELVEEHLKTCENCKKALANVENDKLEKNEKEEIDYLKKVHKKMNRKTKIIIVISSILLLLVIFNAYILVRLLQPKI